MRTGRIVAGLVVAIVAPMTLVGCVQPSPRVIPTSEPSSAPVFASDAAALDAAKKAFAGYVAASNAIGNDGGARPDRIAVWVTPDRLKTELSAFAKLAASTRKLSGAASFSKFSLQQLEQSGGHVSITAYACDDVSKSRVLDSAGTDITPSTRQDVIPLEVRFQNKAKASRTLLVDGSDPWSGANFCS